MQYHSIVVYMFLLMFTMTILTAQANKEREKFASLLEKRKHLNGYWVGKRYAIPFDADLYDNGN